MTVPLFDSIPLSPFIMATQSLMMQLKSPSIPSTPLFIVDFAKHVIAGAESFEPDAQPVAHRTVNPFRSRVTSLA